MYSTAPDDESDKDDDKGDSEGNENDDAWANYGNKEDDTWADDSNDGYDDAADAKPPTKETFGAIEQLKKNVPAWTFKWEAAKLLGVLRTRSVVDNARHTRADV